MAVWYIGSTKWSAVTAWSASTAKAAGVLVRQSGTPSVGNERVFVCIVAGTTGAVLPWTTVSKGEMTIDNTVTWQECTGQPAVNGDATNTPAWSTVQSAFVGQGYIIKNNSATHYFICSTSGGGTAGGTQPTFNTTTGATTVDNTITWTCIGAVGNFSAWGGPHARVRGADANTWGLNGDIFYISNHHAETQTSGALNVGATGSATAVSYYLCVNDSAAPPTSLATTATISCNAGINLSNTGKFNYVYGITFTANSPGTSSVADIDILGTSVTIEDCVLKLGSTNGGSVIKLGPSGNAATITALNCNYIFTASGQRIVINSNTSSCGNRTLIGGTMAPTGAVPSLAFDLVTPISSPNNLTVRDMDLSQITGTLININENAPAALYFENCKLGAGVTLSTGTLSGQKDSYLHVHNCDDGTKNYRFYTQNYMGNSQQETTTVRTGGASDGVTPVSYKLISTANACYAFPFQAEEIAIWNEVIGVSMTATVEIAGAAALNTNEIWVEVEYLGSSAAPLGSVITTKAGFLTTGTAVPISTATWGGSPSSKQKLEVTITPQMRGVVKARVYLAKPSTTVYVDPYILLSNNVANRRQYLLPGYGYMNETAEGEYAYQFVM